MPDHVHLLAEHDQDGATLGDWIKALKAFVGKREFKWQPGFFDHVVRTSRATEDKWEYVFQNPVRAGLAKRAEDWPFAGRIQMEET
jgi:putative transposase